jgi:hypothetical protein
MDNTPITPQEAPKRRGNPNFGNKATTAPVVAANEHVQAPSTDIMQEVLHELRSLRQENEALKASVDQQKYAAALNATSEDKRLQVRLRTFGGVPILSWSNLVRNEVRYVRGEEIVDQKTRITYLDGTEEELMYDAVFNNTNRTDWLPVNSTTLRNGKSFYAVEYEGKEYFVEDTFINA